MSQDAVYRAYREYGLGIILDGLGAIWFRVIGLRDRGLGLIIGFGVWGLWYWL